MTDALTKAAQAALDALDNAIDHLPKPYSTDCSNAATDLRAALAAQQPCQYCNDTGDVHGLDGEWLGTCTACKWGSAQKAAQPVAFDHDIGADRYQVVKGSFWWHVRIGDSTANVGKFHTKMAAEDMALKLLTAFRDGAFMQSRAAQPVAWGQLGMLNGKSYLRMNYDRTPYPPPADVVRNLNLVPLFAAAQPQQDAECKPYGDLRNAKWLDPECYGAGACQSLKFKAAQQAAQPVAQEPIHIEAVAEVVLDDDDVPTLRWLVEGGVADLPAGMVLMISDLPLTDDYGSGEVFRASQPQQAPLKERPDFVAGYDAGLADGRRIAEREQAAQPVAWQPIDTAPKDGNRVLIFNPVGGSGKRVMEAAWSIHKERTEGGIWRTPFGPWGRGFPVQPDHVTHWMPLPAEPLFAAAQPQQAISAPAQIDLSNEWPTTRYFVKQVMARFGIGPNENIASALRKLYAEAPAQPQQASPHSSST